MAFGDYREGKKGILAVVFLDAVQVSAQICAGNYLCHLRLPLSTGQWQQLSILYSPVTQPLYFVQNVIFGDLIVKKFNY